MSKSILYASNTTSQVTTAAGSNLNFGAPVRRYGCDIGLSGGNVTVNNKGYYHVDTQVVFTSGGAGTVQVQLLKDGVAVPGATASFTAAENSIYAVGVPCVIRNVCCCESTLTATVSGVAGTVTSASAVVEKL